MKPNVDEEKLTAYALGELRGAELAEIEALLKLGESANGTGAAAREAIAAVEETRAVAGILQTELRAEPVRRSAVSVRSNIEAHLSAMRAVDEMPPVVIEAAPVIEPKAQRVTRVDFTKPSKGIPWLDWPLKVAVAVLFFLTGVVAAVSIMGNRVSDIVGTLAVILPGAQTTDDHKIHSAQLIEFTDGNDDTYQILDTHIGSGDSNRLNRNTGLGDSNTDSIFVVQDID